MFCLNFLKWDLLKVEDTCTSKLRVPFRGLVNSKMIWDVTFLQDAFRCHFPQTDFYKEPEISQSSKTPRCFTLFCEIKFPTRQFNNFSDVLPSVEWDFHLKSVKAYIAPLSCLSILTIWLWGLWHSPRITFLYFIPFTLLQLPPPCFTFSFVISVHVYIFLTYTAPPQALQLDLFIPNNIYLSIVTFQAEITSQNIPIRFVRDDIYQILFISFKVQFNTFSSAICWYRRQLRMLMWPRPISLVSSENCWDSPPLFFFLCHLFYAL